MKNKGSGMSEDIDRLAKELQAAVIEDAGEIYSKKALRAMMEPETLNCVWR